MVEEIDEQAAAARLGITVNQLRSLGRDGAFGAGWTKGSALPAAVVAAAKDRLYQSASSAAPTPAPAAPPRPPPASPAAPPPAAAAAVTSRVDDNRRGGRRGGGGPNVRTGREVEIPARAWVASVQRTDVQWRELQAIVAARRLAGDDAEQIRAQLVRAGVPVDVVDQMQPR